MTQGKSGHLNNLISNNKLNYYQIFPSKKNFRPRRFYWQILSDVKGRDNTLSDVKEKN